MSDIYGVAYAPGELPSPDLVENEALSTFVFFEVGWISMERFGKGDEVSVSEAVI